MRNIVDASKLDLKSTIVSIRRVAKTVKGGRNMRFSRTTLYCCVMRRRSLMTNAGADRKARGITPW